MRFIYVSKYFGSIPNRVVGIASRKIEGYSVEVIEPNKLTPAIQEKTNLTSSSVEKVVLVTLFLISGREKYFAFQANKFKIIKKEIACCFTGNIEGKNNITEDAYIRNQEYFLPVNL